MYRSAYLQGRGASFLLLDARSLERWNNGPGSAPCKAARLQLLHLQDFPSNGEFEIVWAAEFRMR
jgi:hypothetical protein